MANPMQRPFDCFMIPSSDVIEDVASLMGPTSLKGHIAVDQRKRGQKAFAFVDNDQFENVTFKSPPIQIIQEPLSGRL